MNTGLSRPKGWASDSGYNCFLLEFLLLLWFSFGVSIFIFATRNYNYYLMLFPLRMGSFTWKTKWIFVRCNFMQHVRQWRWYGSMWIKLLNTRAQKNNFCAFFFCILFRLNNERKMFWTTNLSFVLSFFNYCFSFRRNFLNQNYNLPIRMCANVQGE